MAIKSSFRIEYSPDGNTFNDRDSAHVAIPAAASNILLDFDDGMSEEKSNDWSSVGQDSNTILAASTTVRGRGGRVRSIRFSRIIEHLTIEAARLYIDQHDEDLPGGTVFARIVHESERLAGVGTTAISTQRAHLQSAGGSITGGTETTFTYAMRWQLGLSIV